MKKIVVIDACMRPESRTKRIAKPMLEELGKRYELSVIELVDREILPVNGKILDERNNQRIVPQWAIDTAHDVAQAEYLMIIAPFWDMSFPAMLKVFIEHISLFGITFKDNGKACEGLCRCKGIIYVTTRGMNIHTGEPLEQATPYLKALSKLWSLGELHTVAAENLDYSTPDEIENKISVAIAQGIDLCRKLQ